MSVFWLLKISLVRLVKKMSMVKLVMDMGLVKNKYKSD